MPSAPSFKFQLNDHFFGDAVSDAFDWVRSPYLCSTKLDVVCLLMVDGGQPVGCTDCKLRRAVSSVGVELGLFVRVMLPTQRSKHFVDG